jgi:hypothetical protein
MAQIQYDASTAGGQLVAEATAELIAVVDKWQNLAALVSEVGNITDPFAAGNFADGSNTVFSVSATPSGNQQAFHDQIVNINSALNTAVDATLRGRLMSLYQG